MTPCWLAKSEPITSCSANRMRRAPARLRAVLERAGWWAETLTIPCVAYAASLDEAEALAQAHADFVRDR